MTLVRAILLAIKASFGVKGILTALYLFPATRYGMFTLMEAGRGYSATDRALTSLAPAEATLAVKDAVASAMTLMESIEPLNKARFKVEEGILTTYGILKTFDYPVAAKYLGRAYTQTLEVVGDSMDFARELLNNLEKEAAEAALDEVTTPFKAEDTLRDRVSASDTVDEAR
jgi:hypothetical protein